MKRTLLVASAIIVIIGLAVVMRFQENDLARVPEIITVGICADFPPFTFRDYSCPIDTTKPEELVLCPKNPGPIGFEIDLLELISKKLKKHFVLREMPFESLIPALELNQINVIAAGMSSTPERAKRIAFTRPYATHNPLVLITSQAHSSPDLEHLPQSILYSVHAHALEGQLSTLKHLTVEPVESLEIAFSKLAHAGAGIIAPLVALAPHRAYWDAQPYTIALLPEADEEIAFGIHPSARETLALFNAALAELEKEGALDELRTKWNIR